MKDQDSIFSPEHAKPIDVFTNENYLDEPQDTGFKKTIINSFLKFKKLKEDMKKQSNEIR